MPGRRAEHGFTLLEVMVATAIAGVSLAAVCCLLGQVMRTADVTGKYARAELLAESKLDELTVQTVNSGLGTFDGDPGYEWKLEASDAGADGLQKLKLTVEFSAAGGKREVVLQTLHADRTLSKREGK